MLMFKKVSPGKMSPEKKDEKIEMNNMQAGKDRKKWIIRSDIY